MILSICPNPAIDVTLEMDIFNPFQLNRVEKTITTYSGKGINVAKGISLLKAPCTVSGFMFENHASYFVNDLSGYKINSKFIIEKGNVRVNYKLVDSNKTLTELNSKGDIVTDSKKKEMLDFLKRESSNYDLIVVSGSLPLNCGNSFYKDISNSINPKAKKIFDTEGDKLLAAVSSGADLIKPNLYELQQIVKRELKNTKDIIEASKFFIDSNVKIVLVSLGEDGAVITNGKTGYYAKSPKVKVESTVGAGDSMVASCAVSLVNGLTLKEILINAVSAGTASVMSEGTNLFLFENYEKLKKQIYIEELNL